LDELPDGTLGVHCAAGYRLGRSRLRRPTGRARRVTLIDDAWANAVALGLPGTVS
jgi:hypothetical protein